LKKNDEKIKNDTESDIAEKNRAVVSNLREST